ncbi:DUF1028 domain-containing protein [Quadrisphaera granulorum]|nr:DUF1028 domain-containing protein [Quadrisphaera granulorum]
MTLSIIARCEETGRFGFAVASCVLAVGTRIGAARAGVGAVAVQDGGWLHWRDALLDLLDRGLSAAEATAMIALADDAPASQLAAVGPTGNASAFTGPRSTPVTGHLVRGSASAQANTMAVPDVPETLLSAFEAADGPLEHRLVAALLAADTLGEHGPDYRGRQSAAVRVVPAERGRTPTGDADDPHVDLRIDDSAHPTQDLARLLDVHRAHRHLIAAGMAHDDDERLAHVRRAAQVAHGERVVAPLLGIRTALAGDADTARDLLREAARVNPATWQWAARSAERAAAGDPGADVLAELVREAASS